MKHHLPSALAIALVWSLGVLAQTLTDPDDYVLVSYRITPQQEELFDGTDAELTEFWSEWDTNEKLDYIHELPYTHGRSFAMLGFEGEDDCALKVKSCYGEKGLYYRP